MSGINYFVFEIAIVICVLGMEHAIVKHISSKNGYCNGTN